MKGHKLLPMWVVAAGLLAYHNSFTGPFIFDDVPSIRENSTIRHLWPLWQALSPPHWGGSTVEGRPIINLSLAVNYALGGYEVWGYHALNLTIHILAGLTLLGVVRRTLQQPKLRERFGAAAKGLALATAALWTVHPLTTESVTYVVQRAESIMGLFYLLTLYCFIRGAESPQPGKWYGLCVTACALGMASKEVMASAPLMVMLYDRMFLSGSFREGWRRRRPLYLALAGTWILLGYLVFFTGSLSNELANAKSGAPSWWTYFLSEPGVILHYLRLSVWPHPVCFDYYWWPLASTWVSILPPALVMALLLGASARAWKTNCAGGFLGAWFFLILAPSSSVIPLDSPAFEHRMYLPLAAVVFTVTLGGFLLGKDFLSAQPKTRQMLGWGVGGVPVLLLSILTIQRNGDYRSEVKIWLDTVQKCPNNARAHNNLGLALWHAGKVQEAIGQYDQSLKIKPDYVEVHYNLAVALAHAGRVHEAIGHYEQALRIRPNYAEAHNNLGAALCRVGRSPEAIGHYEQALRIEPDFFEAHHNLALTLLGLGRNREAKQQFEEALRIKPDMIDAHYDLGSVLLRLGDLTGAIEQYELVVQRKPDYAEAHNNLGVALVQMGRLSDAKQQFEETLRLKPDHVNARKNLDALRPLPSIANPQN